MTNKLFVLSVYPDACCKKDITNENKHARFVIFTNPEQMNVLGILGYSNNSTSVAWRSAARKLRKEMLEQLEK